MIREDLKHIFIEAAKAEIISCGKARELLVEFGMDTEEARAVYYDLLNLLDG